MYLQNKYSKCYFNIIHRAKSRELALNIYTENHHIIPKSCGGDNSKYNLVKLTAREHFICHLLLPKMTEGLVKIKMIHAAWLMCCKNQNGKRDNRITSHTYSILRKNHSDVLSAKVGILNQNFGKKRPTRTKDSFTKEWKEKISASKKGKPTWNNGVTHSAATKKLQSTIAKNRIKKECPHCSKLVDPSNFLRWHGDNCRNKI